MPFIPQTLPSFLAKPLSWLLGWIVLPWVLWQERRILREGRMLDGGEMEAALRLGVKLPEEVRVLEVKRIPNPLSWLLGVLERLSSIAASEPLGMTLRYGIYLREGLTPEQERELLLHELVHVRQYEEAGGARVFLQMYLGQCLCDGYAAAALEEEASRLSAMLVDSEDHRSIG